MLSHAPFVSTCKRAVRVRSPYSLFSRGGSQILQLTLAKDSDSSDDSSASEDDDLEMLLLSTLWPPHKELGCHINCLDIPEKDFENMVR